MPDTKLAPAPATSEEAPQQAVPQSAPPPRPAVPPAAEKTDDEVDIDLMRKAAAGDMTSYALLFRRHSERIGRLAYLILHSAVASEDVVQDTFTRGLSHIASYRGEAGPRAWFSSIALNVCRHIIRDRKKEAELAATDKLEHGARVRRPRTRGVLTSAIRREENWLLTVAMGFLTEAQREVFVLHYVDGLPYEDVARILGIRAGAARALAHRAKSLLYRKLGGEEVESLIRR